MKIPKRLRPLVEEGLIDEVLRQLMSGKEANVYAVRCGKEVRCAKVYKDAAKRSFRKAVQYQEGRKVRNSRRARAMEKGSRFGRQEQEAIWQNTEVDALYRVAAAGVRVPQAFGCVDGVLLMEMICDAEGYAAPRLNDVTLDREQALAGHAQVMQDVARMLSVGLIHGDLSEFNVLMDASGPVIIDLPQVVNAAANNQARGMLERDVRNITAYYARSAPELFDTRYAAEIWALYEDGELHGEVKLSGQFSDSHRKADVDSVLLEIKAAFMEEQARLQRLREARSEYGNAYGDE